MTEEEKQSELGENFRKVLNRHGYAFQYAVIKFASELRRERRSEWDYLQSEFPVIVNGKSTRIDFVLRKPKPHVYLVAECKRVNPAYSDWCFASSKYARGDSSLDKVIFQYAWEPPDPPRVVRFEKAFETGIISTSGSHVYHVGRAVRSKNKGDSNGKASDEIEDACGQACKGLNGLVEHFFKQEGLPHGEKMYFLPTIITTARIWTTSLDLSSAQIEKGEFEGEASPVTEKPWIWYQYHLSPELKHSAPKDDTHISPFDLSEILSQEFARTIAIVSVKGIEDFLYCGFPFT